MNEKNNKFLQSPLLSVIVPIYNVEKYLEKCVRSIQAQTYRNLEIILVDDGSPDRCGEIADRLAAEDPRIRVFHQPNSGVAAARNLGLDNMHGEFFTFVDPDDYLGDDNTYAPSVERLINDKSIDIVQFPVEKVSEEGVVIDAAYWRDEKLLTSLTEIIDSIYCAPPKPQILYGTIWNKIYRKSVFKKIRFKNYKHGQDTVYLTELFRCEPRIQLMSKGKYCYVHVPGSAVNRPLSKIKEMCYASSYIELFKIANEHSKDYSQLTQSFIELSKIIIALKVRYGLWIETPVLRLDLPKIANYKICGVTSTKIQARLFTAISAKTLANIACVFLFLPMKLVHYFKDKKDARRH